MDAIRLPPGPMKFGERYVTDIPAGYEGAMLRYKARENTAAMGPPGARAARGAGRVRRSLHESPGASKTGPAERKGFGGPPWRPTPPMRAGGP